MKASRSPSDNGASGPNASSTHVGPDPAVDEGDSPASGDTGDPPLAPAPRGLELPRRDADRTPTQRCVDQVDGARVWAGSRLLALAGAYRAMPPRL